MVTAGKKFKNEEVAEKWYNDKPLFHNTHVLDDIT